VKKNDTPACFEGGDAVLNELRVVHRVVVQHHDTGTRAVVAVGEDRGQPLGKAGHLLRDELQVAGGIVLALVRVVRREDQAWAARIERGPGTHHIDPAAGRGFVPDEPRCSR
jgi:hypothetical protein